MAHDRLFGLAIIMAQAVVLQVVVVVLRMATSYQSLFLDMGALELGAISAGFAILPVLLAIPIGRMVDRRGHLAALDAGTASLLTAALCFAVLGHTVLGLVLGTVFLGLAHFLTVIGQHAMMGAISDPENRNSQFGWYTAAISFGQIIGPSVIALFSRGEVPDTAAVFQLCVMLAFAQVLLLWIVRAVMPGPVTAKPASGQSMRALFRLPRVKMVIFCGVAVMAGFDLIVIYLPVLGASNGIDAATIAALLMIRATFTLLSRLSYGFLSKRIAHGPLLGGTVIAAGVGIGGLALPLPVPALAVAIAISGFGLGVALPLTLSWLVRIAPPSDQGLLLSARQSAIRIAQLFIPLAGGAAAAVVGGAGMFVVLALYLSATGLIVFASRT